MIDVRLISSNIIFMLFTGLLIINSCKPAENKNGNEAEKTITVSILPQEYFVKKIAGENYQINVMVPPGASPATYDPTPRQMSRLAGSDIYLRIGEIAFEKAWLKSITSNYPELPVKDLSNGISFIRQAHHHHGKEEIIKEGADPHIWVSTLNARIIARNTFVALKEIYPEDSVSFRNNYHLLLDTVNQVDSIYSAHSDELNNKHFLIYHPALGYLARDYNMHQIVLEFEGKEPPPAHIRDVIETAHKHNINTIFIQSQFSTENARSLAQETGADIVQIDPLSPQWKEMMLNILNVLTE